MTFIRAKEIPPGSGNWYDYEVESIWNKGKVRQKVLQYLGKSGSRSGMSGGSLQAIPADVSTASTLPIADDTRITKMKTVKYNHWLYPKESNRDVDLKLKAFIYEQGRRDAEGER